MEFISKLINPGSAAVVLLGAFFMATDPVTSPVTDLGKIIFGIGCGIGYGGTAVFRLGIFAYEKIMQIQI